MDKLTPKLTGKQLRENINSLISQKLDTKSIQAYVDNYDLAKDGSYTLKGYKETATDKKEVQSEIKKDTTVLGSLKQSGLKAKDEIMGTGASEGISPITRGFQLASTITGTPIKAGMAAIPESVKTGLDKTAEFGITGYKGIKEVMSMGKSFINWLGEKIGDTKIAQDFVMKHPEEAKIAEEVALSAGALTETANNLLVIEGGSQILNKLKSIPKVKNPTTITPTEIPKTQIQPATILDKTDDISLLKSYGEQDSKLLSVLTGKDKKIIDQILKNPEAADIGIRNSDTAIRDLVTKGSESSIKIKNSYTSGYQQAKDTLLSDVTGTVSKQKTMNKMVDMMKEFGAEVKGGKAFFNKSKINANPTEVAKIRSAYDTIKAWDDWSFKGVDKLKGIIGDYRSFEKVAGVTSKSPMLGKFYNYIDETIKSSLPKDVSSIYSEINKTFSNNIGLYDDMVKAFNSADPFKTLSNMFGKNSDRVRQIVNFFEKQTGENVSGVVAGREIAMPRPASQWGILNPRQWIDFFVDPKVQADWISKYGKFKKGN